MQRALPGPASGHESRDYYNLRPPPERFPPLQCAPPNDDFANRVTLTNGAPRTGTLADATIEQGEFSLAAGKTREAATDALLNIQDRAAIPLWKTLQEDADGDLRDVAQQAIAALEALK